MVTLAVGSDKVFERTWKRQVALLLLRGALEELHISASYRRLGGDSICHGAPICSDVVLRRSQCESALDIVFHWIPCFLVDWTYPLSTAIIEGNYITALCFGQCLQHFLHRIQIELIEL